jgi:hypothetical protein
MAKGATSKIRIVKLGGIAKIYYIRDNGVITIERTGVGEDVRENKDAY